MLGIVSLIIKDQSRLECRTCLPNRKSQTGGYYKDDNKIDFRVFLGLNISLKSIHKDFAIFNTENSFLGKLGPNLTQWLEMGGLAQRKESSFRSLSYPPSMHLSFTFNNHFPFFVVVAVVVVFFFFLVFAFFFFDKDVCTCSFEPLEHFFCILLLLELKWPIIVLCYKLLCFTWISVPEKTLNTSSEIMIFFSSVFDLVNQFLTRCSPFAPMCRVVD